MIRTVYLHAGMHKTGSTSIQSYLRSNRRFLAANGRRVIHSGDPWQGRIPRQVRSYNCSYIANILIRNSLQTSVRLDGRCEYLPVDRKQALASDVNRFLHDSGLANQVISAEAFCFLRTDQEKALYDQMFEGIRVVPIVYFRDKRSWLASWKKQLATNDLVNRADATPNEGVFDLTSDSWLVDYEAVRRFFGPSGIYLDYDAQLRREGSVVPGFLRALNLDDADCPSTAGFFQNRSAAWPRRMIGANLRRLARRWI